MNKMELSLQPKPAAKQSDGIRNYLMRAVAAATLLQRTWPDVLFGLLVILNVVRTLRHAMWRDELEAFQIAAQSTNLLELFQRIKLEGHPGLWHMLLWGLTRFSTDPILMQLLHIGIAVGAWLLIYRCSPFTISEKFLLILSYFLFWEYFVISRNYALVALLGFGFVALRTRRPHSEYIPWILLGLLANTVVYGTIWSMALAAVFVVEQFRLTTRFIGGVCTYLVCLAIAVATMMPPGFSENFHQTSIPIDGGRIHALLNIPIGAFFPIRPDWIFDSIAFFVGAGSAQLPQFWNPNPLDQLDQFLDWFLGNSAELPLRLSAMLTLPIAIFWMLVRPTTVTDKYRRRRRDKLSRRQWSQAQYALTGFMIVYIGIILFAMLFNFTGYARHQGTLFLALVGYVWSSRIYAPLSGRQHILWSTILTLSAISGISTLSSELRPFSNGRDVAAWLELNNLSDQLIIGNEVALAIAGYLKRPIYQLECECEGMFIDNLLKHRKPVGSVSDLIDRVDRAIDKSGGREAVLILIPNEVNQEFITVDPDAINSRLHFEPVQVFEGAVSDEDFNIYRVTKSTSTASRKSELSKLPTL